MDNNPDNPPRFRFSNFRAVRIFIFIVVLFWCAGFSLNALFPHNGTIILYPVLKQVYSGVCHQTDYKTFALNNLHFLVCARCTGIYAGALIGSFVLIFLRGNLNPGLKYFFISSVPMIIDVIGYHAGFYEYSKWVALATGLLFGSAAIVYILASIEKILFKEPNVTNELK